MVYAGFDQSIGRDCNGDGRITSDIDITGDGLVTLADREQGAFLAVNPWGRSWGDRGMAWVLFRDHAITRWPWSQYIATVQPAPPKPPRLWSQPVEPIPDWEPDPDNPGGCDSPDDLQMTLMTSMTSTRRSTGETFPLECL